MKMIDPDSCTVLLSFCDLRTQLRLSQTCRAFHSDVSRAHKPHKLAIEYMRKTQKTRDTNIAQWKQIPKHSFETPEILYELVQAWVNCTSSIVRYPPLMGNTTWFANWSIPVDSHIGGEQLVLESLLSQKDWYFYTLGPPQQPKNWAQKSMEQIAGFIGRRPMLLYGCVRALVLWLECHVYRDLIFTS